MNAYSGVIKLTGHGTQRTAAWEGFRASVRTFKNLFLAVSKWSRGDVIPCVSTAGGYFLRPLWIFLGRLRNKGLIHTQWSLSAIRQPFHRALKSRSHFISFIGCTHDGRSGRKSRANNILPQSGQRPRFEHAEQTIKKHRWQTPIVRTLTTICPRTNGANSGGTAPPVSRSATPQRSHA